MGLVRAALAVAVAVAVAAITVSGGDGADPRTPPALPGLPAPFLGTAVIGSGGRTAAVDAYGDIVDLRAPGPAGRATIAVPAARQAAGTVPADAAVVARLRLPGSEMPFWRADSVRQRYLPGTNVLRTVARLGSRRTVIVRRIGGPGAARADRRWLARARPLGAAAPSWAGAMYRRSLLVLRALTDRRTGAVAAGARDGWAYVWPRDAATVAIAFASAGYRPEARRVARFLKGLGLDTAARFHGTGAPVPGRNAQGDAAGWVAAASRATGPLDSKAIGGTVQWRGRADYQEGDSGDYLANAIASGVGSARIHELFGARRGLVRIAEQSGSGFDSTAAWAVRPFPHPALYSAVRRTLFRLASRADRFGIAPSEDWRGGEDPWTAPTAWTAWAFAALANHDRRAAGQPSLSRQDRLTALRLMADLRRAATPLGLLPERVDAQTGLPRSTTPLAWSHALAILSLRELWPGRAVD
ncbi:MAG TPA: glycoside hydrolase family 15 protein [Solirubrobacterales bacterium]|nr:glycoside hydrolase family 15 protein [Solirubrobacterales bacterium]